MHKLKFILILAATLMISNLAVAAPFTPEQTKAIEKTVHNYLVNNPEVLVEVSKALQSKETEMRDQNAQEAIRDNINTLFNDKTSPVQGNPNGDVVVVEFFDYQCSHCKRMTSVMKQLIKTDSKIRVVYKEFPIFGENSQFAAKAALASVKQGKYSAFHKALMDSSDRLNEDITMKIAKSVSLDTKQLKKDMNDTAFEQELKNNLSLAKSLGIMGTPAFVVANNTQNKNDLKAFFIPGATDLQSLQDKVKLARK